MESGIQKSSNYSLEFENHQTVLIQLTLIMKQKREILAIWVGCFYNHGGEQKAASIITRVKKVTDCLSPIKPILAMNQSNWT